MHTPRFWLFRKDQLWHVSCYWVSVNIMLSSIMEIYAFQLARFWDSSRIHFAWICRLKEEQRDKVIYIKERFYNKLVIKNGAFNTLRYEKTPHLRWKLKSSSTSLKTVIKMLCKRILRNLLCFHLFYAGCWMFQAVVMTYWTRETFILESWSRRTSKQYFNNILHLDIY